VRVYLDACCLNRLTDDQHQARIREEAEAVEHIFRLVRTRAVEWVSSDALRIEVANNPDQERRDEAAVLLSLATETLSLDSSTVERARALEAAGYGAFDALHISAAESRSADVLLTTDDRFIKRAARGLGSPRIRVVNPVEWLRERIA
jgi:predicted nucleic acid-binding protein